MVQPAPLVRVPPETDSLRRRNYPSCQVLSKVLILGILGNILARLNLSRSQIPTLAYCAGDGSPGGGEQRDC